MFFFGLGKLFYGILLVILVLQLILISYSHYPYHQCHRRPLRGPLPSARYVPPSYTVQNNKLTNVGNIQSDGVAHKQIQASARHTIAQA